MSVMSKLATLIYNNIFPTKYRNAESKRRYFEIYIKIYKLYG